VLQNIIHNALQHTPKGTTINIKVENIEKIAKSLWTMGKDFLKVKLI
jgi:signal transduction histidine kinase